jgi:uncharacterized protein involved in exopolysaccharide biosynthesis
VRAFAAEIADLSTVSLARMMLGTVRMKAFNRIVGITAALLIAGSAAACKNDAEKREENVQEAREKVIEKTEKVQEQQGDVAEAKAELAQARAEFLNTVDARLTDLDARIVASKTNAAVDHGRLTTLRAEANALRAQVADETRPFAQDAKNAFERIVADIETELDRK